MRRLPAVQWVLRSLIAVGPVVVVLLAAVAGAGFSPAFTFVVGLLGLVGAAMPASPAPTVTSLLVVVWWAVRAGDELHPVVLLAAACLLVAHVGALLAELGPASYAVDRPTVVLWVRRAAAVWTVAAVAWLVGRIGTDDLPGLWSIGALVAVVLAVAGSGVARRESV